MKITWRSHNVLEIEKPYLENFLWGLKYLLMDYSINKLQLKEAVEKWLQRCRRNVA